jgi:lysophospholipase L1-like esterase
MTSKRASQESGSLLPKLAVLSAALLICLLIFEGGLRIYNPIAVPLRANQIVLPVNNRFETRNAANSKADPVVRNTYNALGFRGPDKPDDFEAYTSVVTVGGSTTACVTLDDTRTWPARLYEELKGQLPKFWLNNAGLDGHSTFGHMVLLREYLADLKPDYILYLTGVNDVARRDLADWDAQLDPQHLSLTRKIVAASELLSTLQVVTRTFRAIDLGVNPNTDMNFAALPGVKVLASEEARLLTEHRDQYVPQYGRRIRNLLRATLDLGIQPVVLTQPALYGDAVDPTLGIDIGELEYGDGISASTQWRILELYNDEARKAAHVLDVPLVDLARLLPKDSRYYFDWVHYSNEGAQKVADLLSTQLLPVFQGTGETPGR